MIAVKVSVSAMIVLTFKANFFNVPIRVVDTAGFEGTRDLDEANLSSRHLNK